MSDHVSQVLPVLPRYSPCDIFGITVSGAISSTRWREQLLLHPSCIPPRRGGGLRAWGTASAWNGWWTYCCVWDTCQRSFRASRLLLRRLTETYSSQFHNVLLTSYGTYLLTSPPLRDASALRVRAHNFLLPPKDNKNFLSRVLYNAICPHIGDA